MGEYIKNLTGLFHVILINKNTCRVVVQLLSCVPLFATPIDCSKPGFPILHNPLQFAQVHVYESVMLSNHLILCHSLLLTSVFPSSRVFPMSWLFTSHSQSTGAGASVLPTNIQGWFPLGSTGLISLQCKEISKRLLQHHNLKATIFQCSAFYMIQFSHQYMTTGKNTALTIWTFLAKWCLLFNMLSRFVIAFLPKSKHLLISWLQSPSAVILELPKIVWHFFHCFSIYFPWSDGTRCHDLHFLNVEL